MQVEIPKLKFSEPRHNLPGRKGVATQEDRFTIAFGRAYLKQAPRIHSNSKRSNISLAREIPVNGYGIADLVAVSWKPTRRRFSSLECFLDEGDAVTRAFECKIKDWRAALSQAVRYRYFSHQAVVVLPTDACENALKFLDTFKKTKVGLWSFDPGSERIHVHHTPRASFPKSEKYLVRSTNLVNKAAKLALPIR